MTGSDAGINAQCLGSVLSEHEVRFRAYVLEFQHQAFNIMSQCLIDALSQGMTSASAL